MFVFLKRREVPRGVIVLPTLSRCYQGPKTKGASMRPCNNRIIQLPRSAAVHLSTTTAVITAGTAIREAIDIIKKAGGETVGVIIALDRQERGQGSQSAVQEVRVHGCADG